MNYTQKKSSCEVNFTPIIDKIQKTSNSLPKSIKPKAEKRSSFSPSGGAPLVKTELCCRISSETPKLWEDSLPNFVKKYVRKHTATYCMIHDGSERIEDKTLLKFATRLSCCNSKINDYIEPKSIDIKETKYEKSKSRHISGTIKCGSPWICPSCSATLSMTRGDQLKHMVECGREHGRAYGMAVLTVKHKPGQALEKLQDILTDVWRKARTRTPMRNFLRDNNIRFAHKGYEIMASIKNGKSDWHPHFNIIFDYDSLEDMTPCEKIKYEFNTAKFLWKICNSIASKYHGIELKEPFLEEVSRTYQGKEDAFTKEHIQVKGGVSFNLDFIEEYTTKFGLVEEATAGMYKNGKGSFHPFQILDMIRKEDESMTKREKILLIRMFREYATATKGKSFFRFAPKSVKYYQDNYDLELNILDDELEIQNRESQGDVFYSAELTLWKLFSPNNLELANLMMQNTPEDMENYILQIINKRLIE